MKRTEHHAGKSRQEALRSRMRDERSRWQMDMEALAWAMRQAAVPPGAPATRVAEQRRKRTRFDA